MSKRNKNEDSNFWWWILGGLGISYLAWASQQKNDEHTVCLQGSTLPECQNVDWSKAVPVTEPPNKEVVESQWRSILRDFQGRIQDRRKEGKSDAEIKTELESAMNTMNLPEEAKTYFRQNSGLYGYY